MGLCIAHDFVLKPSRIVYADNHEDFFQTNTRPSDIPVQKAKGWKRNSEEQCT